MTVFYTFFFFIATLFSQTPAIEGTWISQDDETGKKKSEVLIYKEKGKLYGKITKLLLAEDQGKKCVKCKGEEKDQPIEGLVIIKALELDEDTWEDGTILDPKSGKIYNCSIGFENENTLKVRGYLGFSLLGRTQIWTRK